MHWLNGEACTIRAVPRDTDAESEIRTCEECGAPTRDRKPYCTIHITSMPYVSSLLRRVEAEGRRLRRSRRQDPARVSRWQSRAVPA